MLVAGLALGGCAASDGSSGDADEAGEATSFTPFAEGLDYGEQGNWYSLPESPTADIDVFVIYPTVVGDENEAPYVMDVSSPNMAAGVRFFAERALAPILDGLDVNVYIPKYRQFNASGYRDTSFVKANSAYLSYPRADIYNAYDYYLNNLSGGRDHIVISHSQGSALALMLLSDYAGKYEPKEMRSRMKAAYMPGWGLTDAVLTGSPYLPTATPDDVSTLISWNAATEEEATGDYDRFTWGNETTRSTNPVSWTADTKRASAKDNLVSIVDDKNGGVKQ
jgi:pimeloyl-ACP methyl ester carboxylesterase